MYTLCWSCVILVSCSNNYCCCCCCCYCSYFLLLLYLFKKQCSCLVRRLIQAICSTTISVPRFNTDSYSVVLYYTPFIGCYPSHIQHKTKPITMYSYNRFCLLSLRYIVSFSAFQDKTITVCERSPEMIEDSVRFDLCLYGCGAYTDVFRILLRETKWSKYVYPVLNVALISLFTLHTLHTLQL